MREYFYREDAAFLDDPPYPPKKAASHRCDCHYCVTQKFLDMGIKIKSRPSLITPD